MKNHQVEVDEEVFQFVKKHAEPLVDSFNTAIRRLLDMEGTSKRPKQTVTKSSETGSVPPGTPKALAQILEVAGLVIRSGWSRTDATREIARQRQVTPQSVSDKYGRQLSITAEQFDRLLGQPGLQDLKKLLNGKFPNHHSLIDKWFE